MPHLQQGSVMWANLPAPAGRRPVVVLTRDAAIRHLNSLSVGPITRRIRSIPTEVLLTQADGLPTLCAVTLDNIFTIPRSVIGNAITNLDRAKMLEIFAAVRV